MLSPGHRDRPRRSRHPRSGSPIPRLSAWPRRGGPTEERHFGADGDSGAYTEEVPATAAGKTATGDLRPARLRRAGPAPGDPLGPRQLREDRRGFVTVTPWIVNRPVPLWQSVAGSRDLAWFGDLLTHVEATSCIDENRVFVAGYSNGAFMASLIACHYSSRVAAVAPVAGIQTDSPCRSKRPVPVVAFHGTSDPLVHYNGTPSKTAETLPSPNGTGTITAQEAKVFGTRGIFAKGPSIPRGGGRMGPAQRLLVRGGDHPDRPRRQPSGLGVPAPGRRGAVPHPRWRSHLAG